MDGLRTAPPLPTISMESWYDDDKDPPRECDRWDPPDDRHLDLGVPHLDVGVSVCEVVLTVSERWALGRCRAPFSKASKSTSPPWCVLQIRWHFFLGGEGGAGSLQLRTDRDYLARDGDK